MWNKHIPITTEVNMITKTARDIMTENVLTIDPDWSVEQLADFFEENDISGGPVVSADGTILGVVSVTDIVRHMNLPVSEQHPTHDFYVAGLDAGYSGQDMSGLRLVDEAEATVNDIMTPMVFEVNAEASVQQVAEDMLRGKIHRVFVTQNDKKLLGIITTLDMLKVVRDL